MLMTCHVDRPNVYILHIEVSHVSHNNTSALSLSACAYIITRLYTMLDFNARNNATFIPAPKLVLLHTVEEENSKDRSILAIKIL